MSIRRKWDIALAALLVCVAAINTSVILDEQAPVRDDTLTNLVAASGLTEALSDPSREAWERWLTLTDFRPPLPSVLYQPLMLVSSNQMRAIRATDTIFFLLSIFLLYRLGCRLSGPAAGLLAAALFCFYPEIQGWSRTGNADPIIWFSALLFLRVLITLDLRSPWQASALGLAAGLCTATRLLSLVFMIGPVLWLLSYKVRDRRSLLNLLVAGAWSLSVAGWWYVMQFDSVMDNVAMSSETQDKVAPSTPLSYLEFGWGLVLVGVIPALALLWRRRALPPTVLPLLLAALAIPAVQFVFFWDVWDRYPLALIPVCALVVTLALEHTAGGWNRWIRWGLRGALAALGVIPLILFFTPLVYLSHDLWLPKGEALMHGDARPHDGLWRAATGVPAGVPVININDTGIRHYPRGIVLNRRPGPLNLVDLWDNENPFSITRPTRAGYVLRTVMRCDLIDDPEGECVTPTEINDWWLKEAPRLAKKRVALTQDPNGVEFQLWKLEEPYEMECR